MPTKAAALAMSTHPGPAVAVTLVAVGLGIGIGLEPWRLVLLGLAIAANQASVGLSNDWLDAERDATVGRTDKPVARGDISPALARNAAFVTGAAAILLTLPLGLLATIAHAVFIASAWAYNLGLKKTALSVLPYIVGFGILPAVVTLARSEPVVAAPWALGVGALLGVAAHFANVIPDLEDDRATGVKGLPHRLGRVASVASTYLALAIAAVLAFLGAGQGTQLGPVVLAVTLGVAATGLVLIRRRTRLHFQLIMLAALITVLTLAVGSDRLLEG